MRTIKRVWHIYKCACPGTGCKGECNGLPTLQRAKAGGKRTAPSKSPPKALKAPRVDKDEDVDLDDIDD